MSRKPINREDWLTRAAMIASEELFKREGYTLPNKIRYSVSLPSRNAMGKKRTTIGQCWSSVCSSDGTIEIFITPMIDSERQVFATLVHEMVHAAVGNENGHNKVFKKCALAVGLEGKMTATTMTDETWERMKPILHERLGSYPHARMKAVNNARKQSTRMVKVFCPVTDYKVRMSRKPIDEWGFPKCPCCDKPMEVDDVSLGNAAQDVTGGLVRWS